MKISIDTNLLLEPSFEDWINLRFETYDLSGNRKKLLRDLFALSLHHLDLIVTHEVFRQFIERKSNLQSFMNHFFQVKIIDDEQTLILNELRTQLCINFNQKRNKYNYSKFADDSDVVIFLESWLNECDYLISQDTFLKPFQNYIIDLSSELQAMKEIERDQLIRQIISNSTEENTKLRLKPFIIALLDKKIPEILSLDEIMEIVSKKYELELEKCRMEFLANFHKKNEPDLANETRKAIVTVLNAHQREDPARGNYTKIIDKALAEIVPEIFSLEYERPPYDKILDEFFDKTAKLIHNKGITEIQIEFPNSPTGASLLLILPHSDDPYVLYTESSSPRKLDLTYDEKFMYVSHDIDEGFDFDIEINVDILKSIMEDVNEELGTEIKRKNKEDKEYWDFVL